MTAASDVRNLPALRWQGFLPPIGTLPVPALAMYLVAIAWMYVVVMMAIAEAMSPLGTVLGAFVTLVFYGLLPVSILMYILGTPMRRRARLKAEAAEAAMAQDEVPAQVTESSVPAPDGSGHASAGAIAPEREPR